MTNLRWIFLIITLLTAASSAIWARGGGHGGGHNSYGGGHNYGYGGYGYGYCDYGLGGYGYDYPFFYNRPYYAYPPTVIVPSTPPVYIQQAQPVQPQLNYWYYIVKTRKVTTPIRQELSRWLVTISSATFWTIANKGKKY